MLASDLNHQGAELNWSWLYLLTNTNRPITVNQGAKKNIGFNFTKLTAKSCSAPLTAKVTTRAHQAGIMSLQGFITYRDK